jgi:hypothetical protein
MIPIKNDWLRIDTYVEYILSLSHLKMKHWIKAINETYKTYLKQDNQKMKHQTNDNLLDFFITSCVSRKARSNIIDHTKKKIHSMLDDR